MAAVVALAARSTVPVQLDLPDLGPLPALVEQAAYFMIAEALTNAAKHSRAARCEVTARITDGLLVVTVSDDGTSGAHLAEGTGLAGLTDRLHSAGGQL